MLFFTAKPVRFRSLPNALLRVAALLWIASALVLSGCSKQRQAKNPNEKRYPLVGEVLAVDPQQNVLTVRHEEIKDYMPAMTMEFSVTAGDIANARKGQHIRAELVTEGDGVFRLERIWVDDAQTAARVAAATNSLIQDTVSRGKRAYREVGEAAPEFALYDQDGRVVEMARFRGKMILLNFIFTRCPVPTMCPAAVARFQQTQSMAKEAGVQNLELVSITMDPGYDTPGVLKTYAITRGIDTGNYSLLTGPENAIKSLLDQFGVLVSMDGDLLNHTLATLLIDENGRIVHRADGSRWEPREFLEKMKRG